MIYFWKVLQSGLQHLLIQKDRALQRRHAV